MERRSFDVVVLGAGFSGSLMSWILAQAGRSVLIVDPVEHPRFAIGESSTPLADFLIEQISLDFNLPKLADLSRWGRWQEHHPELRAGKKRGFSYFQHFAGEKFSESAKHENSLLVAASASDELSDTHWLRSDVDHWFFRKAISAGTHSICPGKLKRVKAREPWRLEIESAEGNKAEPEVVEVDAAVVVDASGAAGVIPKALGVTRLDDQLVTRSGAIFGHFQNVGSMDVWLSANGCITKDAPFRSDDAAQHHLLDDGWLWMLRFAHGVTSVGRVWHRLPQELSNCMDHKKSIRDYWSSEIQRWPTVDALLSDAQLIGPLAASEGTDSRVPNLRLSARMSRLWGAAAGQDCFLLPGTTGVVDPLHSTGIAHALWGVREVGRVLLEYPLAIQPAEYSERVVRELRWIDRLVASAYQAQKHGFDFFCAACCLYFACAIRCETQMSDGETVSDGFLCWRSSQLQELLNWFQSNMQQPLTPEKGFLEEFRRRLKPWNPAGLLDPKLHNRIARSAAKK